MQAAGKLNRRITFQTYAQTPAGGAGGTTMTQTYTNLVSNPNVWAEILTVKGSERIGTVNSDEGATHRFRVRHRTDIAANHYILYDGRRFRILQVEREDEQGVMLDLLAEETRDS